MKIAYMIMAHTDAAQLSRLIKSLNIDGVTDFYIHIDKKTDMSKFKDVANDSNLNVNILKSRIYTTWGGVFSSENLL